jgi:hypothetical protein
MRKNTLTLFTVATLFSLCGCDDGTDPSATDLTKRALDKIEKNENISVAMFNVLGTRMTGDSLQTLRLGSGSKEELVNILASQTEDYFSETVDESPVSFDVTTIPTPFSGEAEITLKLLAGKSADAGAAPVDVVDEYSKSILKKIKEQAANDHKEWILIQSLGTSLPSETMSLNFESIKFLATIPHQLFLDMQLSDDEVVAELRDILNENDIPPVAIALLLPAVQKFNETSSQSGSAFNDSMTAWLGGPVKQATSGGLDRDIIRRIHATVYLAALHSIILDSYDGTNVDTASLSVLHARYRASIIMSAAGLWEQ